MIFDKADILITGGGKGTFAEMLAEEAKKKWKVACVHRSQLDTSCDNNQLSSSLYFSKAKIIIHCGAFAKPINTHEQKPKQSIRDNIIGTSMVAEQAIQFNAKLVFISTDYVYPGITGNYKEEDPLKPINFYAQSKFAGEMAVSMVPNHLILRASIHDYPYQHKRVFTDLIKSPLWKDEAVPIILKLIEYDAQGIFNLGGPTMSAFDFIKQRHWDIEPISTKDIPDGKFPTNCSMNTTKLKRFLNEIKR